MLIALSKPYLAADSNARHEQKLDSESARRDIASPQLAERIKELTPRGGPIYILGAESQLFPLSGRQPAARVFRSSWLIVDPWLANEVLQQLSLSPPNLFLDVSQD